MRPANDTGTICHHCTRPEREHRGTDSRCPHGKWPNPPRVMNRAREDSPEYKAAAARWDARIAKHWATATTFEAR